MSAYFTKENLINNSMCGKSIWYFSFLMGVCSSVNFYPHLSDLYIVLIWLWYDPLTGFYEHEPFSFLKLGISWSASQTGMSHPMEFSHVTEVLHLPKYTSPFTVFIFRKIPVQHMFNFVHDFKVTPPLCLSYSSASEQEIKKRLEIQVSWDVTLYWNSLTLPKTYIFSSNNVKTGSCKENILWRKCVGVTWPVTE
jgi:hypothetical protein